MPTKRKPTPRTRTVTAYALVDESGTVRCAGRNESVALSAAALLGFRHNPHWQIVRLTGKARVK